jgi:hypothetical protein
MLRTSSAGKSYQNPAIIGTNAGFTSQLSNSIILNASGNDLPAANYGTFIKPIRELPGNYENTYSLVYDILTGELFYKP